EPQTLYHKFYNAYAYNKQVALCSPNPNRQQLMQECNLTWNQIKHENKISIDEKIHTYFNAIPSHTYSHYSQFTQHSTNNFDYIDTSPFVSNNISLQPNDEELPKNAIYQRDSIEKIKATNQKITEYKQMHSSNSSNYGCPPRNSVVFNAAEDVLQSSPQEWKAEYEPKKKVEEEQYESLIKKVEMQELMTIIAEASLNKAMGPDDISNEMIKQLPQNALE
ncbi:24832_t:CDS:2, partial [Gigaspora rosea]